MDGRKDLEYLIAKIATQLIIYAFNRLIIWKDV
jgi:hypothetical protein